MTSIVKGDDVAVPVTLSKSGVAVDVSSATSIKAAVISNNKTTQIVPTADQVISAAGADWANGIVVVEFASANTQDIYKGEGWIEIQVELGGKKTTWFARVDLEIATIV